jgi:hypothetical protein
LGIPLWGNPLFPTPSQGFPPSMVIRPQVAFTEWRALSTLHDLRVLQFRAGRGAVRDIVLHRSLPASLYHFYNDYDGFNQSLLPYRSGSESTLKGEKLACITHAEGAEQDVNASMGRVEVGRQPHWKLAAGLPGQTSCQRAAQTSSAGACMPPTVAMGRFHSPQRGEGEESGQGRRLTR